MTPIAEINKVAEKAIDGAFAHYFFHLASGEDKLFEAKFVAETLQMIQPWLFFTEEAMEQLIDFIYKDTIHINLVFTLTAIFRQRFVLEKEDYDRYVKHIAESFFTQDNEDEKLSMMPKEYRDRLTNPQAIEMMLRNNRMLVMLITATLYLDTNIIKEAVGGGK
jgi:hypothetical protein